MFQLYRAGIVHACMQLYSFAFMGLLYIYRALDWLQSQVTVFFLICLIIY